VHESPLAGPLGELICVRPSLLEKGSQSVQRRHPRRDSRSGYGAFVETSGRNRWKPDANGSPPKRLRQVKTVAVGCDQLPIGAHGMCGSGPCAHRASGRRTRAGGAADLLAENRPPASGSAVFAGDSIMWRPLRLLSHTREVAGSNPAAPIATFPAFRGKGGIHLGSEPSSGVRPCALVLDHDRPRSVRAPAGPRRHMHR
jgi:hypothetical protein